MSKTTRNPEMKPVQLPVMTKPISEIELEIALLLLESALDMLTREEKKEKRTAIEIATTAITKTEIEEGDGEKEEVVEVAA